MSLDDQVRTRIESLIADHDIVLFMKGTPQQPQCGFSATVTGILRGMVNDYATFNVLDDQEIREGIKAFSQWPTIPQLYINQEFIGGCDVIQQMYASGDLHAALGLEATEVVTPTITISDAAAKAIESVRSQNPLAAVHLRIDANWNHEFSLNPASGHEIAASSNGIEVLFDRDSAARADGLSVDMLDSGGFSISNPNAPPPVQQLEVEDLKAMLDRNESLELLDVREIHERERASIEGSKLLDQAMAEYIDALPKDTCLVFHCHTGVRSQQAAEYFRGRGFTNTHNLVGGIDAWSERVDSSVPRY